MVRVIAQFGFTANGSSDDGRERTILTPNSPTHAAQIFQLQAAGATEEDLHPLVAQAITESARRPVAPRVAAPREPVDPARIGRRVVRRQAKMERELGTLEQTEPRGGDKAVRDELTRPAGSYVQQDVDAWFAHALAALPRAGETAAGLLSPSVLAHAALRAELARLVPDADTVQPPPNPKPPAASPRSSRARFGHGHPPGRAAAILA